MKDLTQKGQEYMLAERLRIDAGNDLAKRRQDDVRKQIGSLEAEFYRLKG